jgi:hypothetical protein
MTTRKVLWGSVPGSLVRPESLRADLSAWHAPVLRWTNSWCQCWKTLFPLRRGQSLIFVSMAPALHVNIIQTEKT